MKRKCLKGISLILAVILAASVWSPLRAEASSASSMIVLEAGSNRILSAQNAHAPRPIASTTKIVTAITVLESCNDLDKVIKVPKEAVGVEGSSIYLSHNEEITIRNLLYGLMLQSGNDCAHTLAMIVGGSVECFAKMMNSLAKKAGAKNSNFVNPHGLHHDEHISTAYDLAVISSYAMKNNDFREIVGTKSIKMPWAGREYPRIVNNKNKILWQLEGGNGIKTGFTRRAGRCLVASARRGEMEVIAVVLNCGPMFGECAALISNAFERYTHEQVLPKGCELARVAVQNSKLGEVRVFSPHGAFYPLAKGEEDTVRYELILPQTLRAPISRFDAVGEAKVYRNNEQIARLPIYSMDDAPSDRMSENLKELNEELLEQSA